MRLYAVVESIFILIGFRSAPETEESDEGNGKEKCEEQEQE
jgi:hypothetical protein